MVSFNDALTNSQPQAGAGYVWHLTIDAVETIKNVSLVIFRDTNPLVCNAENQLSILLIHLDGNRAFRWRVFDGVFDQVSQHDFDIMAIHIKSGKSGVIC